MDKARKYKVTFKKEVNNSWRGSSVGYSIGMDGERVGSIRAIGNGFVSTIYANVEVWAKDDAEGLKTAFNKISQNPDSLKFHTFHGSPQVGEPVKVEK